MKMASKTNAVRLVQQAGFPCQEAFYEFDENDLNGNHAAHAIGVSPEQVFKTLVARGVKTGINVFCIPVCCELDLKLAAKAANDKNMELIPVKDLLGVTGYIRGGCSPVGMKKLYPTVFHNSVENLTSVIVSAGKIGYQVEVAPQELLTLVRGSTADIIV